MKDERRLTKLSSSLIKTRLTVFLPAVSNYLIYSLSKDLSTQRYPIRYTLCLRKNVTFFLFGITSSDIIQFSHFCQFLVDTYPRESETNTACTALHISFCMFALYLVETVETKLASIFAVYLYSTVSSAKLSHQVRLKGCSCDQCKCSKCRPSVLTQAHSTQTM